MTINAFHISGRMDASIVCRLDSAVTLTTFRFFKLFIVRQVLNIAVTVRTGDIAMVCVFICIMTGVTGI